MKQLNEYAAEVHRRVEVESRTLRQHRVRLIAACVPLVLCLIVTAVALPPLLRSARGADPDGAAPVQADGVSDRTEAVPGAPGVDGGPSIREENQAASADAVGNPGHGEADGLQTGGVLLPQETEIPVADGVSVPAVPDDFSFHFVWGCYGISSYDSKTGTLVKTTDTSHPEDYVAELFLTQEQRQEVWELLSALELETYPAEYDPYNDPDSEQRVASEPNRDLILTLRVNGLETTVTCRGICLGGLGVEGYDEKARAFLDASDRLTELLTGTPAWKALPEYEVFYE